MVFKRKDKSGQRDFDLARRNDVNELRSSKADIFATMTLLFWYPKQDLLNELNKKSSLILPFHHMISSYCIPDFDEITHAGSS